MFRALRCRPQGAVAPVYSHSRAVKQPQISSVARIHGLRAVRGLSVLGGSHLRRHFARPSLARSVGTPRAYSTDLDAAEAFRQELDALDTHCSLLNQTTVSQLMALADIEPMMQIFVYLDARGAGHLAAPKALRALRQTAKDSTVAFRGLPQSVRVRNQAELFASLRSALDTVASSVGAFGDPAALQTLFGAYEIVDPRSGVAFYEKLPVGLQAVSGGAVIPCMVKAHEPFSAVRQAFERELEPDSRTAATMAWACLRYGEIDAARSLFDEIVTRSSPPPQVLRFLVDAFIGDAPAELALETFEAYASHVPHHAALARMLDRLWAAHKDQAGAVTEQIAVFRTFLSRLAVPSELSMKTVATSVVRNVVSGSRTPAATLEGVSELCAVYDEFVAEHTVFLNMVLTAVAEHVALQWPDVPEAHDVVLAVLHNYGPADDRSPVAFRVRLNALEHLSNKDELAQELWAARTSLPALPRLQKLDWLALARATNASPWFAETWEDAGSPFEVDLRRFCRARGYSL